MMTSGWRARWIFAVLAVAYGLMAAATLTAAPGPGRLADRDIWVALTAGAAIAASWVWLRNGHASTAALFAFTIVLHNARAADLALQHIWTGAAVNGVIVGWILALWVIGRRQVRRGAMSG